MHPTIGNNLNSLALVYFGQGRYTDAEALFLRSLNIYETSLPPRHPDLALVLENYAMLLRQIARDQEAEAMEARAASIRTKQTSAYSVQ
jgi:hypothetical protein